MKTVESNLSTTAAKFDAGLTSLAWLQRRQQHALSGGNEEVMNWSLPRSLITPPSPRSLSSDSNRPRQRRKRISSSRGRGRSASVEVIDRGAESESTPTSAHASLGQPYTPSLPDASSDFEILSGRTAHFQIRIRYTDRRMPEVHQLETPESSVYRPPVTSVSWTELFVPDSLVNSISKGFGHYNAMQRPPPV